MSNKSYITFVSCKHTSPPAPTPPSNQSTPNKCLSCSIDYAKQQSNLSITTYNDLILDATREFTDSAFRVSSTRDRDEIVSLGKRKVDSLKVKRNTEVERSWMSLAKIWDGATRPGKQAGRVQRLAILLGKNPTNGLTMPRAQWTDEDGNIVSSEKFDY